MNKGQPPASRPSSEAPAFSRKVYVSPELQEWGSVVDLTQGKKIELQDAPGKGGSGGV